MASPPEIGALGSLVSQEIEYFRKVDLGDWKIFQRMRALVADMGSSSSDSRVESEARKKTKNTRKKKVGGGKYLPALCSAADISESAFRTQSCRKPRRKYAKASFS
ncbi:hypothetical protein HPP92_011136 [Vanilla planifolia]|uniref:Uncharacterized protein n=1 Tax=Vanilla planifolia TaxID=51239 RepID=A0A835V0G2_VANPL|nr:hypothetical protein HPP92_011136 [Vanilla planifolia]